MCIYIEKQTDRTTCNIRNVNISPNKLILHQFSTFFSYFYIFNVQHFLVKVKCFFFLSCDNCAQETVVQQWMNCFRFMLNRLFECRLNQCDFILNRQHWLHLFFGDLRSFLRCIESLRCISNEIVGVDSYKNIENCFTNRWYWFKLRLPDFPVQSWTKRNEIPTSRLKKINSKIGQNSIFCEKTCKKSKKFHLKWKFEWMKILSKDQTLYSVT